MKRQRELPSTDFSKDRIVRLILFKDGHLMTQDQPQRSLSAETQSYEKNKFILRLPCEYHAHLTQISRQNRRSMNSEITFLLEQHLSELLSRGLKSTVEGLGLNPVLPKLAHKVVEKFQTLSLEKKKALLALLG